ncbi:plastid division protein PDV1 [Olea europaea var. sylvestris]|uniref:plastid division protein PDV1 n=1 Tax=Olea europaea var. sylvestris TaxID=158386 RepID=UPI000C1D43FF|nr:plastid division protein PDV1 [Olea europaea var. sylvestris]
MKWDMEVDEIEAVLEKIWDLHDKLSDAIHSITRAHFLNSVKNPRKFTSSDESYFYRKNQAASAAEDSDKNPGSGFVFVKELRVEDDELAPQEAKSLYAIRTALENLEDQLEFFHTVQTHQRAERDAAIANLEQSRIALAMRLAEHQGKRYKVIEEARALLGVVQDSGQCISPENLYVSNAHPSGRSFEAQGSTRSNVLVNFFMSGLNFVTKTLKLDRMGRIMGNSALVAISMLALMRLSQLGCRDKYLLDACETQDHATFGRETRVSHLYGRSSGHRSLQLDVLSARG